MWKADNCSCKRRSRRYVNSKAHVVQVTTLAAGQFVIEYLDLPPHTSREYVSTIT